MSKAYHNRGRRRRGRVGGSHRMMLFAAATIGILLATVGGYNLIASRQLSSFVYTIGSPTEWSVSAQIDGGTFGGYSYTTPATIDTSNLPTQIVDAPTYTSLTVDPDRVSTKAIPADCIFQRSPWTPASLVTWTTEMSPYFGLDGILPQVTSGISLLWGVDSKANHQAGTGWTPDPDRTGLTGTQRRYYAVVQVYTQTQAHPCSEVLTGAPARNLYEYGRLDYTLRIKFTFKAPESNSNWTALYDSAKVIAPVETQPGSKGVVDYASPFSYYLTSDHTFVSSDVPAKAYQDQQGNQAVTPMNTNMGVGGGSFIVQVSGSLQAGVVYNYAEWPNLPGTVISVHNSVDVGITYAIMVGVVLSAPPTNPNIEPQWLQLYNYLISVLSNPSSPFFWVLAVVVILIIVYLFRPKKKQSQNVNIYMPSQPERHKIAAERRASRRGAS